MINIMGDAEMTSIRDIGYYVRKARELPPGAVAKRALMKSVAVTTRKLEKAWAQLFPSNTSDNQLLKSLDGFENVQEVLGYIRGERPHLTIDPSLGVELVSLIQEGFPQLKDQIVEEADKVCSHVFDLLGSADVNLDDFIEEHGKREQYGYLPWHFDFKTGYRWSPRKFYKEIETPYGKAY